ncbi:YqaA family protein [Bartonella sp. F02]|uniref:YqaA family protein n=1 Tax=Bartonella sp. F02 TaxID=2967262 RepID=UPI0022A99F45|nr:YqaA family protein [Bartonella sp. F02]MCZ2328850.1 DedA family protein [Bartonella sp. F02]
MTWNTLKLWVASVAHRQNAPRWLGFIAFIESSFFPIPVDLIYIPMTLLRPQKAYHYAFIATLFSVLGGIFGWFIGHFAYDALAKPILEFYDKYESFQALKNNSTLELLIILLLISGFSHIPPIKIVTILSGVMGVNLGIFVILCAVSRGARFYLLAWLIRRFGHQTIDFLSRHLKWVILIGCVVLLLIYGLYIILLQRSFFL